MPDSMALRLRTGRPDDAALVFQWANDPVTRQVSFNRGAIPYDTHMRWYAEQLTREDRNLFIAFNDDDTPVAMIRLDRAESPHRCIISINVAPNERGQGIGTAALHAAAPVAATLGFRVIDAYIRPSNAASLRAFEKAGYVRAPSDQTSPEALRYERDLTEAS